jgi:Hermansky-Pudlak syndrome 5 protein
LLQIIPSKFGLINQVAISKQEKLIAFSNAKGKVGFLELLTPSPQIVVAQIDDCATVLHWLDDDKKLYLGDIKGNVSIVLLSYFMVNTYSISKNGNKIITFETTTTGQKWSHCSCA